MTNLCEIVVSAENNNYMAWQCMLFHHSCTMRLGRSPILVVHGGEDELTPGFAILEKFGARIQRKPNFCDTGFPYPPRNTIFTLASVEADAEYIVLCDPDMLFLAPVDFDSTARSVGSNGISLDRVGYLYPERGFTEIIRAVCDRALVDFALVERDPLSGGAPIIIPNALRDTLSKEWLTLTDLCLEAATERYDKDSSEAWIAVMWGLVLAVRKLGIQPQLTEFCINNFGNPRLSQFEREPAMVHYCYGDESWNKRTWRGSWKHCENVWRSEAPDGTVNGEICRQLAATAAYFGITG